MDIREVLSRPEYDFIKTNPHLVGSMIFATFGGSHAYGTNKPDSDIDIRGCAFNSKSDLLGRTNFEQVIDNPTDTTIYSFNKLIHLLSDCNPNTIELLGCKPDTYVFYNDIGRMMVQERNMFLSQKAVQAFGGYATQQLRRLQAALARDRYNQTDKEKQILSSCQSSMLSFNDRYQKFENGTFHLYVDKSDKEDLDTEIFVDVNLKHYPLRDYKNIWSDLNTIVKEYGKITQRNKKKDEAHLGKHAMHLIRLYYMCLDILEKQEINTYREHDIPLLMSIRNGEFQLEDGTFRPEFYEMVDDLEKQMKYAKENTSLPEKPDYKRINEFTMMVNEHSIHRENLASKGWDFSKGWYLSKAHQEMAKVGADGKLAEDLQSEFAKEYTAKWDYDESGKFGDQNPGTRMTLIL